MSKPEQVLILEPKNELHFKGPFTDVVTSYLKLSNPSERRVCFKVKTTAPKRYCVRPNNGLLEAMGSTTIAVMLQPIDLENLNDKNKHKFMVQTMFAPEGDINQESLWKEVNPDMIMDSKLKCVFDVLPNSNEVTSRNSSGAPTAPTNNVSHTNNADSNSVSASASPQVIPIINKSSSAKASVLNSGLVGDDTKKLSEENRRLREELASIRSENLQLKEDGLKHRIRSGIGSSISPEKSFESELSSKYSGSHSGLVLTPQLFGIAFLLFIAGILIGKVLF